MRIFLQWFGLDTFTIQENSHFLYPLFSLCTPIFNDQVQLVVKSLLFLYFQYIWISKVLFVKLFSVMICHFSNITKRELELFSILLDE
ncbi:hypothetical protein CWI35_03245 [[Bacillus] caldolyticus]|uniref:Uncharacterized protein n=1 Tax=Bacillus caldolyticus TaxID=1394 RepID=A0ABM6QJQ2_BACCL|nr:hypothetical protein CWI35_03245 [[Bacillus] caldolyticus]